ncbi:methyl-accepting chemotaxis protein [Candidatus Poribacteria bacterium]|nr:methyl-accepting chemotaxis protein [Candidatus Poribacteria bacterium]
MANFYSKSLMNKIIILFLAVSLIPIAIIGYMSYASGKDSLQKQLFDALATTVSSRQMSIIIHLEGEQETIKTLATDSFIHDVFEKISKKTSDTDKLSQELSEYLLNDKIPLNEHVTEIMIINLEGKIVASSNKKDIGADKSSDEYFIGGSKGTYVKDVYLSKTTSEESIAFSAPIINKSTGKIMGVIASRSNTIMLNQIISNRDGLGETGEVYIVNKNDLIITKVKDIKDAFLKQKVDTESVKLYRSQKKNMVGIYRDYGGDEVVGATSGAELYKTLGLDWIIIAEIHSKEALGPVNDLGLRILWIGLIIGIIVAFIAFFIAQRIANPLRILFLQFAKIGEGDLTQEVTLMESEDEIGILSNSARKMLDGLKEIVKQVLDISERVSSSSQQLSSSAEEMNATTQEVSTTVQQIAKGTETQAQRVEETQKIMEQMTSSVDQVSKSAQKTALQAATATDTAHKGGEAAKDAQNKMAHISEVVFNSATSVKKLGERSDQIGEIVNVITDIADQTNLLALNAAIEAARAGEYGRGFAVVAEEVRKLAEGSAKAADEIGKLIKDVQKETTQAVNNIESAAKETTVVKDIALKLGDGLNEIIKNSEQVGAMVQEVSAISEEQASGTKQVTKSITDIAAIAEETASATEEASASSEEMTASMEEMAASAQELADMGMQLREMVGKFKIDMGENRDINKLKMETEKNRIEHTKKLKDQNDAIREKIEMLKKNKDKFKNK